MPDRSHALPTLDAVRHAQQTAWLEGGEALRVGSPDRCPLPPERLAVLTPEDPVVTQVIESGLTAHVYRLHVDGRDYALKKARPSCLVQNTDGRLSFLNELLRRAEIAALQRDGAFAGIVPTLYGSLAEGIILSPWISGGAVIDWDERRLRQVFASGRELILNGLFEWDLCPGNLMDDGRQVWLFDFGYTYRFDPLTQFNSAGHGDDFPAFHLAERFETRNYFAWLLQRELAHGLETALAGFRLEKTIALETYRELRADLAARQASSTVLAWLDGIIADWAEALRGGLHGLYLREAWRSHVLDLEDDLRGRTCTPQTLVRCDWLLSALENRFDELVAHEALLPGDIGCDRAALSAKYGELRIQAQGLQV